MHWGRLSAESGRAEDFRLCTSTRNAKQKILIFCIHQGEQGILSEKTRRVFFIISWRNEEMRKSPLIMGELQRFPCDEKSVGISLWILRILRGALIGRENVRFCIFRCEMRAAHQGRKFSEILLGNTLSDWGVVEVYTNLLVFDKIFRFVATPPSPNGGPTTLAAFPPYTGEAFGFCEKTHRAFSIIAS